MHLFVHFGQYPDSLPCELPCKKAQNCKDVAFSCNMLEHTLTPDDLYTDNPTHMFSDSFSIVPIEGAAPYRYKLSIADGGAISASGIANSDKQLSLKLIDRQKGTMITEKTSFSSERGPVEVDVYVDAKDLKQLPLDSYVLVLGTKKES